MFIRILDRAGNKQDIEVQTGVVPRVGEYIRTDPRENSLIVKAVLHIDGTYPAVLTEPASDDPFEEIL